MLPNLLKQLRQDCQTYGHGRKKWWAEQLNTPPLTLSHWLVGRQKPNGDHALRLQAKLQALSLTKKAKGWKDCLWQTYYAKEKIPKPIISKIILELLAIPCLDSRTWALLSRYISEYPVEFSPPESPQILNRLGWLLSISGVKPGFRPDVSVEVQSLLESSFKSKNLAKYFRRLQTPLGKKWRVWDCPLQEIKKSLP